MSVEIRFDGSFESFVEIDERVPGGWWHMGDHICQPFVVLMNPVRVIAVGDIVRVSTVVELVHGGSNAQCC